MTDHDGGFQPLLPLSPEPATDLKGKGLPWPVFLAIGLLVVVGIGFIALKTYQGRQRRKVHVAFMEQFAEFEKNDVNAFWRCLFGKEGDARRFSIPDQMTGQLEGAMMIDPKDYPVKVQTECVPKAIAASKKIKDFSPVPPQEYDQSLDTYGKTLLGLANAFSLWSEGAPKRVDTQMQLNKVKTAGDAWTATGNPRKPDPDAMRYDRFLRCAVPNIEKLKTGQELLEFLASKCIGKKTDPAYLATLRDKCIPEAQEAPAKAPASFAAVLKNISGDFDRETQAWDSCFRGMRKGAKKDDLEGVGRGWTEAVNASTQVRKIGKEMLKDD